MTTDPGEMTMRLVARNQDDINAAERVLDVIKKNALREFERLERHLTKEQLLELAGRCSEEDHDDTCVYCAALGVYNARE